MNKILSLMVCVVMTSFSDCFAQSKNQIPVALIHTACGEIFISLNDRTPRHKASFIELAEAGYWDSFTFNRVIPNFVAQGGCPDTEEGFNDPDYLLEPEFDPELTHIYGAVGAGRDDNPGKLSARCQFYIVQNPDGLHRLDGDYTVFGQVIKGMGVIEQLVRVERDEKDEPLKSILLDINILYLNQEEYNTLLTNQ